MNNGFQCQGFQTWSKDGRNCVLLKDADYLTVAGKLFRIPAGATSDGASTPQAIWNIIPPFGGHYWQAAFLHDAAYRDTLLWLNPSEVWQRATLAKDECDLLLLEAMTLLGAGKLERDTIYEGVIIGGTASFFNDRAAGWTAYMVDVATLA